MNFPPDFPKGKRRAFLQAVSVCGILSKAAKAAKIHLQSHYNWMAEAAYRSAFHRAMKEANDFLEDEARKRALFGVRRYKFFKGVPIMDPRDPSQPYYELEKSDALLALLLKGNIPEKYKERIELGQKPEEQDPKDMTDEELIALIGRLEAQLGGGSEGTPVAT